MALPHRRFRPPRTFYGHLGAFVTVGLGLSVLTLVSSGEFWWYPLLLLWAAMVVALGVSAYWRWRRDEWEVRFDPEQLSPEQREELEWDHRTEGFTGGGGSF